MWVQLVLAPDHQGVGRPRERVGVLVQLWSEQKLLLFFVLLIHPIDLLMNHLQSLALCIVILITCLETSVSRSGEERHCLGSKSAGQ